MASYRLAFRFYVIVLALMVAATVPAGLRAVSNPVDALLWVVFIAAANLLTVPQLPKLGLDASLGAPVSVAAAVVLPPPLAVLVNVLGFTNEREFRGEASPWMVIFNRTQAGLAAGAASLAAHSPLFQPAEAPARMLAGTVAAVVVYNLVNTAAVTMSLWTRGRLGLVQAVKGSVAPFPRFALDFGLVTLLALLVVVAYQQVGYLAVLLLALPLWLGYSALRSARESADRAEELAARVRDLETLHTLGTELLTVRSPEQIADRGRQALRNALESADVDVSVAGDVRAGLQVVKIFGAEPAAVGVPDDVSPRSMAMVEAVAGLIGMALQRVELEQELGEAERARAALSGRILEEGTRERSRLALRIHDDVLPYFAAAEIQADNVHSAQAAGDAARAAALAAASREAIHDGIAGLRAVLDALRRQVVVPGGLLASLRATLDELRLRHGVSGALRAPDPLPPLPLAVEILVLETVRGCLANVARHAEADHAEVSIDLIGSLLAVRICDDGRGFDVGAVPAGRQGLALMTQRVRLARGSLSVTSAQDRGTQVRLEVPL